MCSRWFMGVIVNRHFINKEGWEYSDGDFKEKSGFYNYCKKWVFLDVWNRQIKLPKPKVEKKKKKQKKLKFEPPKKVKKPVKSVKKVRPWSPKICRTRLAVILNLSPIQKEIMADRVRRVCKKYWEKDDFKDYPLAKEFHPDHKQSQNSNSGKQSGNKDDKNKIPEKAKLLAQIMKFNEQWEKDQIKVEE